MNPWLRRGFATRVARLTIIDDDLFLKGWKAFDIRAVRKAGMAPRDMIYKWTVQWDRKTAGNAAVCIHRHTHLIYARPGLLLGQVILHLRCWEAIVMYEQSTSNPEFETHYRVST